MTLQLTPITLWLWVIAGTLAAVLCLPSALCLLRLSRVRIWGEECPAAAEPPPEDGQFQLIAAQLRAAGLVPVGPGGARLWFIRHHWCLTRRRWYFATPQRDCYVYLCREWSDEPLHTGFLTGLTDGTLIETLNHLECQAVTEPQYVRWGYATQFLGELLDLHRRVVEQARAQTGAAVARHDLASILALEQRHSERQVRKRALVWGGLALSATALGVSVPACYVATNLSGFGHWVVPLTSIVSGLTRAAFSRGFRREERRLSARKDAECASARRAGGAEGADGSRSDVTEVTCRSGGENVRVREGDLIRGGGG